MGKAKWMKYIKYTEMGNPHAICLKMTKRQRLNSDWWMNNYHLLKIQSNFQGNLKRYIDGWSCFKC